MRPSPRPAALACGVGLALLAAGCQTAGPDVRRSGIDTDACAERLHDLSGRLLLYYSLNRRLPPTLEALAPLDPQDPLPPVCPVSGEPYVYRPDGLEVAGWPGRLVLYDARPSHSGMRWGVLLSGLGGKRITARVVLVPDDAVLAAAGAAAPAGPP